MQTFATIIFALILVIIAVSVLRAVFMVIFTYEDIITRSDADGYADRRGVRIARFTIPFFGMVKGEQVGNEYYVNQMQWDRMTE
tara:strand:+ start:258 stop:509 length:252 start_codon:yes stop_codon:yes gene_type:complete